MRLRALALALPLLISPATARATGMQGHIYMAQCGAELSTNPKVKQIFEAHPLRLANGGMFPDSGYASSDHDQGEIAHWEGYVEGYIEQLRERHGSSDAPEAQPHLAFLFGLSAHGITDSTFDTLFFPRVEALDSPDDIDLAADVLLDVLLKRKFIPDPDFDAQFNSDVFTSKIPHDVTPDAVKKAMSKARSGIGATVLLSKSPDFYLKKYPWEHRSLLDPRVPGAYAFGSKIVVRYYDELLRRVDGSTSADGAVIGTYPSADYPMVTLNKDRPDGRIYVYFGIGIERDSLDGALRVLGPDGVEVPATIDFFRGDKWPNVIQLAPKDDWKPNTTYTIQIKNTFRTLQGTSPAAAAELSFTTCTPDSATGDCAEITGSPPPSPCPITDKLFVETDDSGAAGTAGEAGAAGETGSSGTSGQPAESSASDDGGCSTSNRGRSSWGALLGLIGAALLRARRKRA